jgi:hypothetical protein
MAWFRPDLTVSTDVAGFACKLVFDSACTSLMTHRGDLSLEVVRGEERIVTQDYTISLSVNVTLQIMITYRGYRRFGLFWV